VLCPPGRTGPGRSLTGAPLAGPRRLFACITPITWLECARNGATALGGRKSHRRAPTAARDARDREHSDEILDLGGEFGLSRATQHYFAGWALADIDDAQDDAAAELEEAAAL
jgi:hypothetical protein